MKVNYHKWLELTVVNNYFPGGKGAVFNVIPLNNTARHFQNYNLLIRKNNHVFSFYIGLDNRSTFDLNRDFEGLTNLYFQVIIDDPLFFNYTDIPYLNQQQIFYFDNTNNPEDPGRLQQGQFVGEEDLVILKPKMFTVLLPAGKLNLEVRKYGGLTVKAVAVDGNKTKKYLLDLHHQEDGLYELWFNNQRQETFFLSEKLVENCIGILHFDIKNLAAGKNVQQYELTFNARAVYWQYRVVVREERKIEVVDMKISGMHEEAYQGPEKQQIIGGQVAQVFTTTTPVQLRNKLKTNPQLQLTYSNDFSDRKKQLEIKLPNPDVEGLKKYSRGEYEGSFLLSTIVYV